MRDGQSWLGKDIPDEPEAENNEHEENILGNKMVIQKQNVLEYDIVVRFVT